MASLSIINTPIIGVHIINSSRQQDNRGSFSRFFCQKLLAPVLGNKQIVQINHSVTINKGSIRGMHFQRPPHAEIKLVRCLKGSVFDVALDLRSGSNTFLQWYSEKLTPENNKVLVIPAGCAHGFQTLENDTELLYLHTAYYQPKYEGGMQYSDPAFNIRWPLACVEISEKDENHQNIDVDYQGVRL